MKDNLNSMIIISYYKGGIILTEIKEYISTPSKLRKLICFIDGVALRFIPMFFILAIANALILKIMFDEKVSNKFTAFFLCFTALIVSILWTRLVIKIEFSVFNHPVPPQIKKKALSRRGTSIIVFYILLKAIRLSEKSNDIVFIISKKLVEFSFAITILVLITTFIIVALRKPLRR